VRGQLDEHQRTELLRGLPEGCEELLEWWHRKEINVDGERREITHEDYDGLDPHHISD